MKTLIPFISVVLLFFSCTEEEKFTPLSSLDDYVFEITVNFEDSDKDSKFKIVKYYTNEFDRLESYPFSSYSGTSITKDQILLAFKEYKIVGISIEAVANVKNFSVELKQIFSNSFEAFPKFQIINESLDTKKYIFYNFETKELSRENLAAN
ncbi:hypothetical protein [Polaribacter cellanae]|uniref:Uncharacterized protein n=1 Tax=Polaribacter cellanae TaxID=2818493 RepID=A0A975CUP7_9FLAO|nr:hypothetical protein [Polaribacter cellanae]QTE23846.1 hypothetical protein J3359_06145 [Polaribacter cellanae]